MDRRVLLGAVLLLALVVRLAGLGDRLSDAEGYSWYVASAPGIDAFFERLAAYENTPPLFYALLAPLPTSDEAWLRLPALIPSLAAVVAIYCLVRQLLGDSVALLAALALAVAPFHVSYANYSRGFMLAGLGLLLAAWAIARLASGGRRRWWWLYLVGAAVALHSEYDSVLFLGPLLAIPPLVRRRGWREAVGFGTLPLLTLLPLVGEMRASADQLDVTKLAPPSDGVSFDSVQHTVVSLLLGTHGVADAPLLRAIQAIVVLGVLALAALWLGRGFGRLAAVAPERRTLALWLLAWVPGAAVVLHAVVSLLGPEVFDARYLSGLIPFAVALLASVVVALPTRGTTMAAAGLLVLGAVVFETRHGRELQPDVTPAADLARAAQPRTVLTNSALVAYYLRDLEARVDRPFNLGGRDGGCEGRCAEPIAIVEDVRVPGAERVAEGGLTAFGPITVRIRQ